jgi:hypothetical protein
LSYLSHFGIERVNLTIFSYIGVTFITVSLKGLIPVDSGSFESDSVRSYFVSLKGLIPVDSGSFETV